ncbi:myrosinase 1-like [Hyposmocoma kahamanoa]|uniref:myrosinase 1-like n=1 Tax=Hyposmocoma kahamanoa TaxID=1477025 RepID=UPI000E6D96C1|nr:myrosinase 1-like [Hyposmocoma kahamanoa]
MEKYFVLIFLAVSCWKGNAERIDIGGGGKSNYTFPKEFIFGVSTAAAQIEGAWNLDGKSESIWDHLIHTHPEFVKDHTNPDVAADSYHLYKRDAEMIHELGVDVYRFSIAWPRVLPTGFANKVNALGIQYYRNLIDELQKYNVTPMVSIYHWDLPQKLQDIGGWTNAHIVDYYTDYANILFKNFADKVKYWVTFNEPMQTCLEGYGGTYRAPALNRHGIAEYLCTHNLLKAHANVYHLFDKQYRPVYGGKIGMSLDSNWAIPKTNSTEDREAAELYLKTHTGWYAHPVYSAEGNYPPELIKLVDDKSLKQNYSRSRLPKFSPEEVQFIKGTADFFGLNHYTSYLLSMADKEVGAIPSHENDVGIVRVQDPCWPSKSSSDWLKVVPVGFRRLLQWVTKNYAINVPIIVTENGFADFDGVADTARCSYYKHYLNALLHAIHEDRSNVAGYFAWSLMDNFEWDDGFRSRFGLYLVDFDSPNKTRTPKHSAKLYSSVISTRSLPADYDPEDFSAFSGVSNPVPTLLPIIAILYRLL